MERVQNYMVLLRYNPLELIEITERRKIPEFSQKVTEELNNASFWKWYLNVRYKITMNSLDFEDLATFYNTFKIITRAKQAVNQYKENGNFDKAYHMLGKLLIESVEHQSITALNYLISQSGAPIAYSGAKYLADAIEIQNWNQVPIEFVVNSGRLDKLLQDSDALYRVLIRANTLKKGDSIIKYIVSNDKRPRKGESRAYAKLLKLLSNGEKKCKRNLLNFLLDNIPYTIEALSDVLEDLSIGTKIKIHGESIDLDFSIACATLIVDRLFQLSPSNAKKLLQLIILKEGSKNMFIIMMNRLQLENNKDLYIEMIKKALRRPKFNRRIVLSLYKEGMIENGFLPFVNQRLISSFIEILKQSEQDKNHELLQMLNVVLNSLPK